MGYRCVGSSKAASQASTQATSSSGGKSFPQANTKVEFWPKFLLLNSKLRRKHARKHPTLSSTELPGQVATWPVAPGVQCRRMRNCRECDAALLLVPTFPAQLSPSPALPCPAKGAFRRAQHAAHCISFLFTTILPCYLFIHSYFYFTLNMPSCVILVLLKM